MKHRLLSGTALTGLAGSAACMATYLALASLALAISPAFSADMPIKAPAQASACAVDGLNSKIAGLGGAFANKSIYGTVGSIAAPINCAWGFQIDGAALNFDRRFLGTVGGHVFTRDPAKGLLGIYSAYTGWNGVKANHAGAEAEWYAGRWTIQGLAGVEFGNTTSQTVGTLIQTYEIKTRFFDQINLAYYATDDLKLFVGHRYIGGKHAVALGTEWGVSLQHGVMGALFAEGRIGEANLHGVSAGWRVYFGQKDKSLIRRHREDDPIDWGPGFGNTSNTGTTTSVPQPVSTPAPPPPGPT